MAAFTVPAPANSGPWRYATHGVGSKSDGGIYTCDIDGRYAFHNRAARRKWLNPLNRPGETKFAHGGFVPVIFGDAPERKNVNVRGSSPWVVLDFDGLPDECASEFRNLAPLTGEWFTSYSQGVKPGGRIRMVLELDRELAYDKATGVDEISPVRAAASYFVAELLGLDPEAMAALDVIDRKCWRPSQYFNVPCHDPNRPQDCHFAELNGGNVLSVDALLARGRSLVGPTSTVLTLAPGDAPPVTPRDVELALEDLDIVCQLMEEHRGPGFGNFYTHGKRLAGRVQLGQLSLEETWDCLSSAIEEGLALEAEANGATVDSGLQAKREEYVRSWLQDPYVHAGLLASRLELFK